MNRALLIEELKAYCGEDSEMQHISPTVELLQKTPDCFWRNCFSPGHITGSGILMNPTGDKVLLNHHGIYDIWSTLGGHADGEENIRNVAMREVVEESGVSSDKISFAIPGIVDVDVHFIEANPVRDEPEHYHFDLVFLFSSTTEDIVISEESKALRWCNYDEANALILPQNDPKMLRLIKKWKIFYAG